SQFHNQLQNLSEPRLISAEDFPDLKKMSIYKENKAIFNSSYLGIDSFKGHIVAFDERTGKLYPKIGKSIEGNDKFMNQIMSDTKIQLSKGQLKVGTHDINTVAKGKLSKNLEQAYPKAKNINPVAKEALTPRDKFLESGQYDSFIKGVNYHIFRKDREVDLGSYFTKTFNTGNELTKPISKELYEEALKPVLTKTFGVTEEKADYLGTVLFKNGKFNPKDIQSIKSILKPVTTIAKRDSKAFSNPFNLFNNQLSA
ncbi:MAG: hypothetical protein ACRCXT_15535, partial [Paraclostridium sp.]